MEREALALVSRGITVDVICLQLAGQSKTETIKGVHVNRLPVKRHRGQGLSLQMLEYLAFFVMAFFQLTRLHRQEQFKSVQVHNLPDFLVFVALIPKLTGAKIILDLHDLMPEFYAERSQRSMDHILVRMIQWQERLSCGFADHVITVTELWRQVLIARGQPAEKVSVVMNVPDDAIFNPGAGTPVSRDGHFRLIYHGILGQRQGLDLLLVALDQIREAAPDIHLTLHGAGEFRPVLASMVDELRLQDRVQFSTTGLPTEQLPCLLRQADLAVVPYRSGLFTGGILPTKLMEYAALGIPAIAARTPAISAYFDDDSVRFFAPDDVDDLANCILSLYRNRDQLAVLGRNIARFSERFNWATIGREYVALVTGVAGGLSRER